MITIGMGIIALAIVIVVSVSAFLGVVFNTSKSMTPGDYRQKLIARCVSGRCEIFTEVASLQSGIIVFITTGEG
jgi:hypothetical protein